MECPDCKRDTLRFTFNREFVECHMCGYQHGVEGHINYLTRSRITNPVQEPVQTTGRCLVCPLDFPD